MIEKMRVLVVLQCAYYHNGKSRARKTWERGLWRSNTGRRLKKMLPDSDDLEITVINATSEVGNSASAILPADLQHIAVWCKKVRPNLVVACGEVAHRALEKMGVMHVVVRHPAWRHLSNEKMYKIRTELEELVSHWPGPEARAL